jgi:phage terminase large subunit-like protein
MWDYVEDVVEDRIVSCEYIKKACERYISDCDREDWEWQFDIYTAARYVNFIERVCVHTRGEMAGTKFILAPWQVFFVGQLFGWVSKSDDKVRRFTTAHLFVARKNGA